MTSTTIDRVTGLGPSVAIKAPVVAATTAAITLSGLQTIDGVVLAESDRVLVKNQSDTRTNGIYIASSGIWNRAADLNDNRDLLNGTLVNVTGGATNMGLWRAIATDNPVVIGTSTMTFAVFLINLSGSKSFRQIIAALASTSNPSGANVYALVANQIDPAAGDAGSVQWLSRAPVVSTDALSVLIQTATGWSGAQMTAFFALADTLTP